MILKKSSCVFLNHGEFFTTTRVSKHGVFMCVEAKYVESFHCCEFFICLNFIIRGWLKPFFRHFKPFAIPFVN